MKRYFCDFLGAFLVKIKGIILIQNLTKEYACLIYTILLSADKQEDFGYPLPSSPRQ
jgi:hypothetical protein